MFGLGPLEMAIVGVIAVLLFGKRLPEVGRSLGKGIVEFKKGLKGVEDEVTQIDDEKPSTALPGPDAYAAQQKQVAQTQFKFDPYTGKPLEQAAPAAGESHKVG